MNTYCFYFKMVIIITIDNPFVDELFLLPFISIP